MSQFRNSIAVDIQVGLDYADNNYYVNAPEKAADQVLRSPEMQQIKSTLKRLAARTKMSQENSHEAVLQFYGLPDHVIEWVLS